MRKDNSNVPLFIKIGALLAKLADDAPPGSSPLIISAAACKTLAKIVKKADRCDVWVHGQPADDHNEEQVANLIRQL